jgi:hypothetical protein
MEETDDLHCDGSCKGRECRTACPATCQLHWEKEIFLIYKEIQLGSVAKSYMRKGFLICEEMHKYLVMLEEAVSHVWLCNCCILNFLIFEENLIFFLISAVCPTLYLEEMDDLYCDGSCKGSAVLPALSPVSYTDKKKRKVSSNIRKFSWDRLQSHIWGRAS